MAISLEVLKTLREKSGAGMVSCKKALEESGGDIEKAMEILRKQGIAKASKRLDREASEGIIKVDVSEDNKEGYIVELNAETDFVARNEKFQQFAEEVLNIIKNDKISEVEKLLETQMSDGNSVKDNLDNLSGVIGEKLAIKRCDILKSEGTVAAYSHMGGRIGVLVALDKENIPGLARDIAMHIAAANPKYIYSEEVPAEEIEKEKEIYREQLLKEGKPENIIDKIIEGKLNKYYGEVCLIEQEYIKEDKKKVKDILGDIKVEKFIRYSL